MRLRRRAVLLIIAVGFLSAWCFAQNNARPARRDPGGEEVRLVPQLGHSLSVLSAVFSPDGRFVLTGSEDGTAKLWEAGTGEEIRTFSGHSPCAFSVAFSPDGRSILTGSWGHTAKLWDARTGAEIRTFSGHSNWIRSVAFSPDGRYVLTGSNDKTAKLWDAWTGAEIRTLSGHLKEVYSVAFSSDGRYVLTGSNDKTAKLWDAQTGSEIRAFSGHSDSVWAVAFSPDGRYVLTGSDDNTAKLWDARRGAEIRTFSGHSSSLYSVAFSSDGRYVLTGSFDKTAKLWDAQTGAEIRTFSGHSYGVFSVAFSPDGRYVLTGSNDKTAKLWDAQTGAEIRTFSGHSDGLFSVAFSSDGRYMLTGSWGKTAKLWDAQTGAEIRTFRGHSDFVFSVAFSPDSRQVLTGSWDNTAKLWDAQTGAEVRTLSGHSDGVHSVAFSPDGRHVLTGSSDNTAKLWDAQTGAEIRTFSGHSEGVYSVAFSPDGLFVLTGSQDKTAKLWDAQTGAEIRTLSGHSESVFSVAFSPDGRFLLTGSHDKTAKLWDAQTGAEIRTFSGHSDSDNVWLLSFSVRPGSVLSVAFSSDSRYVLSGSGTARLWDVKTGAEIRTFSDHSDSVWPAAFSPDGRFVLTGSLDSMARLWDIQSGLKICSLISFDDGTWAVVAPDGRFDTNNLEEMKGLHWVMADDPMRTFPLEIFMRDYYEPKLLPRLLNGERFPPLRSLLDLNRVQPTVRIADVTAQANGRVTVAVEVERGSGAITRQGKPVPQITDVYDLRLFRDGQLVASSERTGGPVPDSDLAAWRNRYRVNVDAKTGRAKLLFNDIKLPRKTGKTSVEFTAYAFNEDRVKSPTDRKPFDLPKALTPAKGRAYVIIMGVNTSQNPAWELRYAANDARKIQASLEERLRKNPDYEEVVFIPLISDKSSRPGESPAIKANLKAVLDLLAGKPVPDQIRSRIPQSGGIQEAAPNDLVLITFSGHGYAGDHGVFYLLPEDVGPGQGMDVTPEFLTRCVSSEELAEWLRDVDAGDMAMVVDACHSAASVEGEGFKPGPMGSRGLGQLSFDKGMRILTASQANRPALESSQLEQGLLSYALVQDGLEQGKADYKPADRVIMLSEWMSYATDRVPKLYEEIIAGGVRGTELIPPEGISLLKKKGAFQQPSLFDFVKKQRDVMLVR